MQLQSCDQKDSAHKRAWKNERKKHTSQNCSCKHVGSKIRCTNMLVEERQATKHIRCEKKKNELKNASQKNRLTMRLQETLQVIRPSRSQPFHSGKLFREHLILSNCESTIIVPSSFQIGGAHDEIELKMDSNLFLKNMGSLVTLPMPELLTLLRS